jgi:Lon protease-like protein
MEKYIPLFPLSLIAFPTEKLNLHIFEPRYKQLVLDCMNGSVTFGVCPYIDGAIADIGTEMQIMEIEKAYSDGRMDIRCKGVGLFQLLKFHNPALNKLYAGGVVLPVPNDWDEDQEIRQELIVAIHKLYQVAQIQFEINEADHTPLSYQIAHKIGLSLPQEYELLQITSEAERQKFLLVHIRATIPVLEEIERTRARIKMNGHFKNLDPLQF